MRRALSGYRSAPGAAKEGPVRVSRSWPRRRRAPGAAASGVQRVAGAVVEHDAVADVVRTVLPDLLQDALGHLQAQVVQLGLEVADVVGVAAGRQQVHVVQVAVDERILFLVIVHAGALDDHEEALQGPIPTQHELDWLPLVGRGKAMLGHVDLLERLARRRRGAWIGGMGPGGGRYSPPRRAIRPSICGMPKSWGWKGWPAGCSALPRMPCSASVLRSSSSARPSISSSISELLNRSSMSGVVV
mmetsp:Transcript_25945/g.47187  ORF Transcript_25945/g.47187 Transcript_25945/m.47187 type:complete len:245 (+) Transcript_25945:1035-1769(+)